MFDDIAETEKSGDELPRSAENICRRVDIIFWDFHPFKHYRYQKQEHDSQDDTDNHESDAIPSFFLVFFLAMRKDEHDDCTDKRIYASDNHQNDHQRQNGQDDILKISISIYSVHDE